MNNFFKKAVPVWGESDGSRLTEQNRSLLFVEKFPRGRDLTLNIAACNFYRVFLNGEFLAFGPARAAEGYFRVDSLPLENLRETNTLAIEVNVYRCATLYTVDLPGFVQYEISSQSSQAAEVYSSQSTVCYEFTARTRKALRFSFQRAFVEDYDYPCAIDEIYLAKVLPFERRKCVLAGEKQLWERGVLLSRYEEQPAELIEGGSFAAAESFDLFRDRSMLSPEIGIFPLEEITNNTNDLLCSLTYQKGSPSPDIDAGGYALFKTDILRTGFITLRLNAAADSEIVVFFDDLDLNSGEPHAQELPAKIMFNRDRLQNHIRMKLKPGRQTFTSFEPYSANYIKVLVLSGAVTVERAAIKKHQNESCSGFNYKIGSPNSKKAPHTATDGQKLEKVMSAALETFAQNAVDLLTDCPSRERAGWLCDSFFLARAELFFTGGNQAERNFLQNYAFSPQNPKIPLGMIDMCYPSMNSSTYIENWTLWYIIQLYDCLLRTGEVPFSSQSLSKVKGILEYFALKENEYGLIENSGGWIFIEWSGANDDELLNDVNFPSNMLYSHALKCAAALFGDPVLEQKSQRVKQSVRALSFNGSFFEDNCVRENGKLVKKGNVSETCQYYAFYFGTATAKLYPKLHSVMFEEFGPGKAPAKHPYVRRSNMFIGNYLRLDYLLQQCRYSQILEETTGYFYSMAERTGTLWENNDSRASVCHGFASYIGYVIHRCLEGIRAAEAEQTV